MGTVAAAPVTYGATSVVSAAPAISTMAAAPVTYTAPATSVVGGGAYSGTGMTTILSPAHVQYVTFQGAQLPHFHETHLRTLHPTKLREHANLLYSSIGHANLGRAIPVHDHELAEWIIWVQDAHLAPLLIR